MGLEVSTYISGLTASWPPSGDPKSQGDDHIRLLKSVLQSTFPAASKALYFPKGEAVSSGPMALDTTDQNNVVSVTTTSGDVAVTLPGGFTTAEAGWSCEVVKVSSDVNAAVVSPVSGSILSRAGSTATIRVGAYCEPARFLWTGTQWVCVKPGLMVGTTFSWDGPTVPYGCLTLDGSAYNTTTFAELFSAFGSATLRDKRGRTEVGSGTGSGLTARVNGTNYGGETQQLSAANLPPQTPAGTVGAGTFTSSGVYTPQGTQVGGLQGGGTYPLVYVVGPGSQVSGPTTGGAFTGTPFAGQISAAFGLLQPSIGTQKLIRAC